MLISILGGLLILLAALTYADLTHDLPSIDILPILLNPPDGLLLQPTRIYDRSGEHPLLTLAPSDAPRHYLPINPQNPQHLPETLAQATIAIADPGFWDHPGYILDGWQNPEYHPTLAQRLSVDLLLWNETASVRRALRERILAAQVTARYGRQQVLEWYLNSANYGRYAFGADAAAQLYLGKPATELNLVESALLAAISQVPSLNQLDAPQAAYLRGHEVIRVMQALGMISEDEAEQALAESPAFPALFPRGEEGVNEGNPAPAFTQLLLAQLDQVYNRARIERGGIKILTTLDYDLQIQASCSVKAYLNRLAGHTGDVYAADGSACQAASLLPAIPPGVVSPDASASAMIIDPRNGQVLAVVGDTAQGKESDFLTTHPAGSLLTPFVYLTGFTRGLSPASLVWDIPGMADIQNFDGTYHGPVRLRLALANDYLIPAVQILDQMGAENAWHTAHLFGLNIDPSTRLLEDVVPLSLLEVGRAYAVFATQGEMTGQALGETLQAVTALKMEGDDHSTWLDWSAPQAQSVVTPQLAYLVTNVLSDETARWSSLGHPNPLEIGRPVAVKLGQTGGSDAWVVGYTPQRVVIIWLGASEAASPELAAIPWYALMQYASRDLSPDDWNAPAGITTMDVCDPSGMLPTPACPNMVREVFLNGNEPTHADTLYQKYQVNRETGYLATTFTAPEMVEERVYMVVPPEAKTWAESAGLPTLPEIYDAIQPPPPQPNVHIASPAMFADLRGTVPITGSASGSDFAYYRIQVGQGLNPQAWIQIGEDVSTPVEDGLLTEWNTSDLNGLYAVQLLVVRSDQRMDRAVTQVSIDNRPPQVSVLFPQEGQKLDYTTHQQVTFQVQASDNLSLAKVDFYLDGLHIGSSTQPPYTMSWSSVTGKHTLRAIASDRSGNQAEVIVTFWVER